MRNKIYVGITLDYNLLQKLSYLHNLSGHVNEILWKEVTEKEQMEQKAEFIPKNIKDYPIWFNNIPKKEYSYLKNDNHLAYYRLTCKHYNSGKDFDAAKLVLFLKEKYNIRD